MACFSSIWKTKSEVERNPSVFGKYLYKEADLILDQLLCIRLN